MQVTLKRIRSDDTGTWGHLWMGNDILCFTAEPSWKNNGPDSCIPLGTYNCIPHNSPKHPDTWEVNGVPNRTAILIHTGNAPEEDSLGCILVGTDLGSVHGLPAVLNSVTALKSLKSLLPPTFQLTITGGLV